MYIPKAFEETRPEVLHELIRDHPFGLLISRDETGVAATHLPFLFDPTRGPAGTLRGHVARANPHWRGFGPADPVLVVFQGPHAYVSPRWYQTAPAVPTWNYAVVHAHGRPRVLENEADVLALLRDTARVFEGDGDGAWTMDSLPPEFVEKTAGAVVAFEIEVERLEGKFKLSQNRTVEDRRGVIAGLRGSRDPTVAGVAALMTGNG